ncbi:T9SS C-terminal target domain-containing protein, partial [bacterium]
TIYVIVDTFTVLEPDNYFAYPINSFTFNILNAKVEQMNADLYVSPTGSNDNSGLTIDEPLKTISYSLLKIIPDSTNPNTINLANGIYSPSQTGEIFPLYWRSYVSLQGTDADSTILDGEGLNGILYCNNDNDLSIQDITIQNGSATFGAGIYLSSSSPSLKDLIITGNTADWGGGVYCVGSSPNLNNLNITENTANNHGAGIHSIMSSISIANVSIIDNNSIISGGGLYNGWQSSALLSNCIHWNNTPTEIYTYDNCISVTYSDIQDGKGQPWFGEGCIDAYPLFVEEGNHLYHLLEGSPCINAGNPDPQYNDPDGTRADMGCYPTVYDVKKIKDKWNWVSFTRLEREGNDPFYAPDVLENIEPFPTLGWINLISVDGDLGYSDDEWYFNNLTHIVSTSGYKLRTSDTDNSYLPLDGSRVAPDTPITLIASDYSYQLNWIGYWLPQTQMSDVAFGDEWNNVWSIKAEDYYYHDGSMEYKDGTFPTYPWGPIPMEYGKGYLVRVHNTITDFQWNYSGDKISVPEKSNPQSFTYTDKPDYEAINIVEIDEGIIEIGVFQNDICVGASVVDSSGVQILAYTDYANKDIGELTFQIVSGRGDKQKVNSYSVYDFTTGEYVERKLTAGKQEYSIVRLNTGGGVTFPTEVSLSQNCPNPFGSNTTISYALPEEAVVEITIYNIRGQRVKTLVNGKLSAGNHSITWNGEDDNRKRLGNGIYLYKLSTGKKEIIKKMLLMMR